MCGEGNANVVGVVAVVFLGSYSSVLSRLPAPISWVALKIHNYLCCVMYVRIQVSRDEKGINNLNPLNLSPVSRFLNCKWGWRLWAAGGGEGKLNSTKVFSSNEKFKNLNSVRAVFQFLQSPCSWTHETFSLLVNTKFPIKLQACVVGCSDFYTFKTRLIQ